VAGFSGKFDAYGPAGVGVFAGIAQQVAKHLGKPHAIPVDEDGLRGKRELQRSICPGIVGPDVLNCGIDRGPQIQGPACHL
jgi:hypothetical protein